MAGETILIGESSPEFREKLQNFLKSRGYFAIALDDQQEIIDFLHERDADVLLLSTKMNNGNGLALLRSIRNNGISVGAVVLSEYDDESALREAIKWGAFDFLPQPISLEKILLSIRNCLERKRLIVENIELRKKADIHENIVGESQEIRSLKESIDLVAKTNSRVLILGESGTGKELVARAIHRKSNRSQGPFIEVKCASIPPNLFEAELFGRKRMAHGIPVGNYGGKILRASGGTLFLDEISKMPLQIQTKVLHVIEKGVVQKAGSIQPVHVDVRIIASTEKNLVDEMRIGTFHEELYYRLNVVTIHTPPLRAHMTDIPVLVHHFFRFYSRKYALPLKSLHPEAIETLMRYSWPGNVRELRQLIEKLALVVASQQISRKEMMRFWERPIKLPDTKERAELSRLYGKGLKEAKEDFERDLIQKVLEKNDWNVARSAQELKIARTYLYKKIQAHKLGR